MHKHAVRGFAAIPALAVVVTLAAGCGSSSPSSKSTPSNSPTSSAPASSPASTATGIAAACQKIAATLNKAPSTLGGLVLHPSTAKPAVTAFINQLKQEAASANNAALTAAVDDFANSVQHALGSLASNPGDVSQLISQLTADSTKITNACSNAAG